MKTLFAPLLIFILLIARGAQGQDIYVGGSDLNLTISGTSNVHDWEETVGKLTGQAKISWNADGSFTLQYLDFSIDVQSIKSTKGGMMDDKTYDALKEEANPTITFKLTSPISNATPGTTISAKGDLKVAGITKPVTLQVKVTGNNSKLVFEGTKALNMKEYGISPPTAFMGAMKVGEQVTIKFKTAYTKK